MFIVKYLNYSVEVNGMLISYYITASFDNHADVDSYIRTLYGVDDVQVIDVDEDTLPLLRRQLGL